MLTLSFIGIIGILTILVSTLVKIIGLPDQIKINKKRKSIEGLSLLLWALSFSAYLLWTTYGLLKSDPVIYVANGIGIITNGILLWQFYVYRNR